jgi:UDP-N-acetylglucosamine--N-acetylmuramyl-(pentapeptide) pyrophosphoryl-undecaprenol N-acetylglucosamine transferase
VLGLGGYAAGPAVVAARRLGVRTAILNPDAIPGSANRRLAAYADVVVLQWDVSRRHFPPPVRCETLGCPIRGAFAGVLTSPRPSIGGHGDPSIGGHGGPPHLRGDDPPMSSGAGLRARESYSGASEPAQSAASARAHFELATERPVLVVTGASQGARTVNQAVQAVWPALSAEHPEWQLLHLTGTADEAAARRAYEAAGAAARVAAFTHEMHLALAAADVVVSRAGASTLAELTALGKPSILMPYPYHRDRHQHANGQVLVDAGAAVMLEDHREASVNRGPLLEALRRLMGDAGLRHDMRKSALALGRPDAARAVARLLAGSASS